MVRAPTGVDYRLNSTRKESVISVYWCLEEGTPPLHMPAVVPRSASKGKVIPESQPVARAEGVNMNIRIWDRSLIGRTINAQLVRRVKSSMRRRKSRTSSADANSTCDTRRGRVVRRGVCMNNRKRQQTSSIPRVAGMGMEGTEWKYPFYAFGK